MASLPAIRADVTRYFGAKPLWLTEYGYQTNPPDRLLGVSYALQARYLADAALRVWQQPGVTLLIQFLVRDEPSLGGWQSGLFSVGGAAKLAYHAFALPLAEVSRRGSSTVLWGQVRPGSGARALRPPALGRRPLARGRPDGEHVGERRLHADGAAAGRRAGAHLRAGGRLGEPGASDLVARRRGSVRLPAMDTALRVVHLLAAAVWVGGTVALVFVAVPPVQRLESEARARTLRAFGERWRPIGWSSLGDRDRDRCR